MKATFFQKFGGPEVLEYGELLTPKPKEGEALVRVRACALNRIDLWLRQKPFYEIPMPHIPGCDAAGVIAEFNGASPLKVGDEVVVNPAIPCGACARCHAGKSCERVLIFGARTQGGCAEFVTVPISQLYPKPPRLSFEESAAFPLTFLTAWHMLFGRANLQSGETVFIWGASGGLGTAGILIAKYLGARVIAAVKSEDIAAQLKKIGADETIIYTAQDVSAQVKKLTNGAGVDVVFESVGEKTWQISLAMLAPYGRLVTAGATSGGNVAMNLGDLYVRHLSILGAYMGTREEFAQVYALVSAGKFRPVIDKVFPIHEAATAHKRMEDGGRVGKIVLTIP